MIEIALVFLVCVSNLIFAYLGFKIGRERSVITIEKGDKVQAVTLTSERPTVYEDEEAYVPDEEGGNNGV